MSDFVEFTVTRVLFKDMQYAIGKISSSVNSHLATLRTSVTTTRTATPKTGREPVQVAL